MTVFVSGASGFIGSHLVRKLKSHEKVVSLIHNPPVDEYFKQQLKETIRVRGDVRDMLRLKEFISRFEVEKVYHLAALASVKTAFKDPYSVYDVNVMGTVSILEVCRQLDVEKALILETDKIYGEKLFASENASLEASEPYATSKCCQRLIAESYAKTYGMKVVIPHSVNAFGYDPNSNRIFPNTIKKCLKGESPIIYTNDDSIREYIYVEDLVDVLVMLMDGGFEGSYNISTGWLFNQKEVVLSVLKHFPGLKPAYVEAKLPPQIKKQSLTSLRLEWKPKYSWDEAVAETINLFRLYWRG